MFCGADDDADEGTNAGALVFKREELGRDTCLGESCNVDAIRDSVEMHRDNEGATFGDDAAESDAASSSSRLMKDLQTLLHSSRVFQKEL